ncbi:hypothetical protein IMG5_116780 [Ichthyophthirius multifiliis]|uniref:Glycosyltransferase subfamily 4-like N-terminal domain-containing protein n=1 Tax=Ichthyophthirius multifiliis TaxID=5932 RepID=G0QUF2_ICHMU|nr:hypothetical protein IMG5_116780 [Ichthyophthirius multifiliis]EGR31148.1 hypothetical protein IMG5_116780 [Ichthyophthirius multifiliis]|eukprot:XP_004034634.1 hypothetical protein IMG5_116780 [Ichthyophthirius multifiliis]
MNRKIASVIVFGDIARSPRMQNHAIQLSKYGYYVYFVGYEENKVHDKIKENKNIQIIDIQSQIVNKLKRLPKILYLVYALFRILIQILQLFHIYLFQIQKPQFVIIQNPPSIPVLSTLYVICRLKQIKMIIDFHNYGFTILQLSLKNSLIFRLAKKYEKYFASKCDQAFCVSKQMQKDLSQNWQIKAQVLYDKANLEVFSPQILSENEKPSFLKKLGFLKQKKDTLILISSTSWTKDEDFNILIEAMEKYEKSDYVYSQESSYPKLCLFITGKGPEKEKYEQIITQRQSTWKNIMIQTVWLQPEDYPKLLVCADFGICLHYSSSGLDLPMKVVDMFSSGLPVFAIDYDWYFVCLFCLFNFYFIFSIHELVEDKKNGFVFKNSDDLELLFKKYFQYNQENKNLIQNLQKNVKDFSNQTFEEVDE